MQTIDKRAVTKRCRRKITEGNKCNIVQNSFYSAPTNYHHLVCVIATSVVYLWFDLRPDPTKVYIIG
jgi:hypothetical protein